MVPADLGRKAGATAKATDGPENRSVQVGEPGKQRLTAGLGPDAGVYRRAFPDGPRGGEALLFTDQAPEFKVSPAHTHHHQKRKKEPLLPDGHTPTATLEVRSTITWN